MLSTRVHILISSLRSILGDDYATLVKKLFDTSMSNFSQDIFNLDYRSYTTTANRTFVEFLKQSYNGLCICWSDPQDYEHRGERTLFSGVFIQQFKLFSRMTRLLYFKWIGPTRKHLSRVNFVIHFIFISPSTSSLRANRLHATI
jgi:hypothetical protein